MRLDDDIFVRTPAPALDELVELAAALSGADFAYVGWMDFNRLCFKAQSGFHAAEQPRTGTACQWMLEQGAPLLIQDAAQDPRFPPDGISLPGVKPCRSYAGAPLFCSNQQIGGTLAILAEQPGRFRPEHLRLLEVLGRMVIAFRDVSECRRLERMKDEFIATVGHELRTPLTSLRASLGLIASGSLDKRPERRVQMVEIAIHNCDRLIRLVSDILDFDSVEKRRQPLHRQPVEAMDLLRRAADVAHNAASLARIGVRIDAASAPVLADEERILQVLNELVANAIKFSPPETTIRLAARRSGQTEVCISVEDQGRGIPLEKLERIFERFQQGDGSDARACCGTGLGLALCRSIVQQHEGHIWAESAPGRGSRFLFTLPAAVVAQS